MESNKDGCQYAVKRSAHRFRGNTERNRSVREARNHERLCPHPHILDFVSAWEESGRLYIQTELCSTSLLLHAENQPLGPGLSKILCNGYLDASLDFASLFCWYLFKRFFKVQMYLRTVFKPPSRWAYSLGLPVWPPVSFGTFAFSWFCASGFETC